MVDQVFEDPVRYLGNETYGDGYDLSGVKRREVAKDLDGTIEKSLCKYGDVSIEHEC